MDSLEGQHHCGQIGPSESPAQRKLAPKASQIGEEQQEQGLSVGQKTLDKTMKTYTVGDRGLCCDL